VSSVIVSTSPALAAAFASTLSAVLGPVQVLRPGTPLPDLLKVLVVDCVQHTGAFELIRQCAFAGQARHVLALVSLPSDYIAQKARQAGARAVFSEADDLAAWTGILERIERIEFRTGGSFASAPKLLDRLTGRQLAVFEAIVTRALTDFEIAEEMGISPATVETHRRDVMRKLRVSRHELLTNLALRIGILDPTEVPDRSPFRQATRQHITCS